MTISTIDKSDKIIDALLKHDSEDPCVHTFAQILDSIFGNENKSPGVSQPSLTPEDETQPTQIPFIKGAKLVHE